MTTAYELVLDALRAHGSTVQERGDRKAEARCLAHDDGRASLSVTGIEGSVLLYCHAGCSTDDVVAAAELRMADLFDNRRGAEYVYPDNRRVHRTADKRFWQKGNTKGRSLFRADRLTSDARTVYVVEGEKDVLAAEAAGAVAVCSAMGAGKAAKFDWSPLYGREVIVVADNDEPGRKHALEVASLLEGTVSNLPDSEGSPTVVSVVRAASGKDLADHVAAGHDLTQLVAVSQTESPGPNGAPVRNRTPVLLDDIRTFLARFVAYPSSHTLTAHTLWIAHTWLMDLWESTPRIAFLSPEPGSGKSRALEVTEPLVPRPVHAVNTSPAYLFRKVSDDAGRPTILYDEIDTVFGPKAKDNEDIRGMLNAGHRKGAVAGRCVMRGKVVETEELPAFCAVALAGLDDLPDTIMTRSVIVRMRRRSPDEVVEPWRPRVNGADAHRLRERLSAWSEQVYQSDRPAWPDMPAGVEDRAADVWEALVAVADLAGGHWPATAREAAVTLVTDSQKRAPSMGVLLLGDIRAVFTTLDVEKAPTEDILAELTKMDEAPWSTARRGEPLDARGLANRLGKYGIGSKAQRDGDRVFKGYSRSQFEDAWRRYLVGQTESVTAVTPDTSPPTLEIPKSPQHVTHVTDVTDSRSGPGVETIVPSRYSGIPDCRHLETFTPPSGPGRCSECGFHEATQGHRDGCGQSGQPFPATAEEDRSTVIARKLARMGEPTTQGGAR